MKKLLLVSFLILTWQQIAYAQSSRDSSTTIIFGMYDTSITASPVTGCEGSFCSESNNIGKFDTSDSWVNISVVTGETYLLGNLGFELKWDNIAGVEWHEQCTTANSCDTKLDLGTTMNARISYLTPTLFYGFGVNDDTPKRWIKIGLGIGAGLVEVNGNYYHTFRDVSTQCAEAVQNHSITGIQGNCEKINASYRGFALSRFPSIMARFEFLSISIDIPGVRFRTSQGYEMNLDQVRTTINFIFNI